MKLNYASSLKHPVFKVISQYIAENKIEAYVIGGFVRDLLLESPSKDIDIVVIGDGPELASAIAKIMRVKSVSIYKNYGTAHFRYKDLDVEFVGARKESYNSNSRNPIVSPGSLSDDQHRRDFTINAMAIRLDAAFFGTLVDPFDGIGDLEKKIIRTPLHPEETFSDDPLRMMRAIRFASQLGFRIEEKTFTAIQKMAHRISIVSGERIADEIRDH